MSGTKAGGLKCAITNRKRHGDDFYAVIGAKGGRNGHTGGFAYNPALARVAGAIGGSRSRRGPAKITLCEGCWCMTKTWRGRCRKCGAIKNVKLARRYYGTEE